MAKILKIDESVIEGLAHFYTAMACGYVVDPVMFGALCDELDELLIDHCGWHPGVPSIHLGSESSLNKAPGRVCFLLNKD